MKTTHIQSLLLSIMLFITMSLSAQKLTVKSMQLAPNDATAMTFENQRQDSNGDYAGIVKVMLAVDGAKFEGVGVIEQQQHEAGEYWVWMTKGSKRIKVLLPSHLPLDVNFFDEYGIKVEAKRTYKLVISIPNQNPTDQDKTVTNQPSKDAVLNYSANGVPFKMIRIEGGTFQMGATPELGSDTDDDEKPVHSVTLDTYLIGETEVTQELWKSVMGDNPSYFKGAKNPVEMVSWDDCKIFIKKLNALTGQQFRLPTEAEWEFAARGGNKSQHFKYAGSNTLDDVAWYLGCDKTYPVGIKQRNELGLWDMTGNVWEWCEDWYGDFSSSAQSNPKGPAQGTYRVNRGGGWGSSPESCHVSNRDYTDPKTPWNIIGLRLAHSENKSLAVVSSSTFVADLSVEQILEMGNNYFFGQKGKPKDYAEALKWFRKAADQGSVLGQYNLGVMYADGYGVAQDYTEALKWYRKAAEQGNAFAQNNLGNMYRYGEGVSQDYSEALQWYRKSAEQGNAFAQNNLGVMYDEGLGVAQDYSEAVKWYSKASDQGHAAGQNNLGNMYADGHGVAQDYSEAVKWYRKAAEQESAFGQYHLGNMYVEGRGVAQDYFEALKWFRKAADQGLSVAQNNLGNMYRYGYGVTQDYSEAVKWYRKAAEQGSAAGQYNLGEMYENGLGLVFDISKARYWYEKAAAQGQENAKAALKKLNDR